MVDRIVDALKDDWADSSVARPQIYAQDDKAWSGNVSYKNEVIIVKLSSTGVQPYGFTNPRESNLQLYRWEANVNIEVRAPERDRFNEILDVVRKTISKNTNLSGGYLMALITGYDSMYDTMYNYYVGSLSMSVTFIE